jgi:hypothetical protein
MKLVTACLFVLFLAQTIALAGLAEIQQTNRVILPDGDWKPREKETQRALNAIQAFLARERPTYTSPWQADAIKQILRDAKHYRVQFRGTQFEKKRVIFCNFFIGSSPSWRQEKVDGDDGGACFWHIYYDPNTDRCLGFESNGYG